VHREQQKKFRRYLVWSLAMAVAFVVAQSIGMRELFRHHFTETNGSTKIYGMSFTLAFVHALHVLGGITFLGFVLVQSFRSRYDHERHWAVDHCTGYWHFLDIVWFGMLLVFVVLR
jgi:heme/copper-type cytochrome/quinol oxidase subunit 3